MSQYQLHSNRSDVKVSDGSATEAGTALLMLLKELSMLAARLTMRHPVGSISILSCNCLGGNNVNQFVSETDYTTR